MPDRESMSTLLIDSNYTGDYKNQGSGWARFDKAATAVSIREGRVLGRRAD